MRSLTLRFSASEISVTLTRFGRKRRLVLLLAWLTLLPVSTALPVSSHSRDILTYLIVQSRNPKQYARNVLARGILRRPYGKSRGSIVTFAGCVKPGGRRLDFHKAAGMPPYGTRLKGIEAAGQCPNSRHQQPTGRHMAYRLSAMAFAAGLALPLSATAAVEPMQT